MKSKLFFASITLSCLGLTLNAQTVSTFDDLTLSIDSFWNGLNQEGGFTSGDAYFYNSYDTSWGGYWSGGFSYSSMRNDSVGDYTNIYSAITASGNYGSNNYAIGQNGASISIPLKSPLPAPYSIYITNTTYANFSIENGDAFGKKFGGVTGNDEDWFLLTILGYNGNNLVDSVLFYLADYRFSDNNQDYIIKDWTLVDLSSLNIADSLVFQLSSSDEGQFGMNTPAYFAIDDFAIDRLIGIENLSSNKSDIQLFPNPVVNVLTVKLTGNEDLIKLTDITGKVVYSEIIKDQNTINIDMTNLNKGLYLVNVVNGSEIRTSKIVKY